MISHVNRFQKRCAAGLLLRSIFGVIIFLISHFSFLISPASAQQFFNLTADEVRIDSVLPTFSHYFDLDGQWADSVYTVSIDYPEFYNMSEGDIARYQAFSGMAPLPELPVVESHVGVSRRKARLYVRFTPLVMRAGQYQKLVSFKLSVKAQAKAGTGADDTPRYGARAVTRATEKAGRYAEHSVLASGQWAKISVPETGIYQLTEALVRQCGFRDISKVKIYGYGGALQPENLTANYLKDTDDLKEVPIHITASGHRLFHAIGPVSWKSNTDVGRIRNPYATSGCYFMTESDEDPHTVDSDAFTSAFYPSADDYHTLYEVDDYAWYQGGRNLYDSRLLKTTESNTYQLAATDTIGKLTVVLTSNGVGEATVTLNDSLLGSIKFATKPTEHDEALIQTTSFNVSLKAANTVALRQKEGTAEMRLDYITITQATPAPLPDLETTAFPAPKFVYRITNQDHHADPQADMVIIIPTSQKLRQQAERLKELHETYDSLKVNIVPADELFNEFASGTPDANAYRRYMKMLYDRAETDADMPRYLLLFGDGAWDNRMLTLVWSSATPDDYLLCYESENSVSHTDSYVSDDYYGLLDDGEGTRLTQSDVADIGIGRLPATTEEEAKILVDKICEYRLNTHGGDWQNVLCFMGDDGNGNVHMSESDEAAKVVEENYTGYDIRRIFWDAYKRTSTSVGHFYPDVERAVKQQMKDGALIMDYCGHGAAYSISHEKVLLLDDFSTQTSRRLPLWVTASCDIMPYDSDENNIGETAMLNTNGGSVAFYGTTRTVWTGANKAMNCGFIKYVLGTTNGRQNTMGDAVRMTKAEVWGSSHTLYNKLHYTLLGDPALALATPKRTVVIDSINGSSTADGVAHLSTGNLITVKGHVEGMPQFDGTVALTMKDMTDTITCQLNNTWDDGAEVPYVYTDRRNILFKGSDSIRASSFTVNFALPRDISISDNSDLLVAYALSTDKMTTGHGENSQLAVSASSDSNNDGIGPSIYCFLNSSNFSNGGQVNSTPYFYAELADKDGINSTGSGIGHDMELVIDGRMDMTYNLNSYFQYDFGNYRSGSLGFSIPELAVGEHTLLFRAWDMINNSSVAKLKFNVVKGLTPNCFDVECTRNPATTTTSFIVSHDRAGSNIDVVLQIFDMSGRQLWEYAENGVSTGQTYTIDWDLTVSSGSRLHTGVYLYRVLVGAEGNMQASKAKKLIVIGAN